MDAPAVSARGGVRRARIQRSLTLALCAGGALLAAMMFLRRLALVPNSWPLDFDLNYIAAHRLLNGQPIYDRLASRAEGVAEIGKAMAATNGGPYSSFIGSPFVALQHAPFVAFGHDPGVRLFRLLTVVAFVAGIVLTARALPSRTRPLGIVVGLVTLGVMYPTIQTLALGQGNGFVVLGLGAGILAVSRERWTVAGVAFGLAAALKLPLIVLVIYLVARGRRRVAMPAGLAFVGATIGAALVGRTADLAAWVSDVLPNASQGSSYVGNQSVTAWLARLTTSETRFDMHIGLGAISRLAIVLIVVVVVLRVRAPRRTTFLPQELGLMVLVVLAAGPLSWDHYFSWMVVPLVLLCDPRLWRGLSAPVVGSSFVAIVIGVALFSQPIRQPVPHDLALHWTQRLGTGAYAVGCTLVLAATWLLLRRAERRVVDSSEHAFASDAGSSTMDGLWPTSSRSGAHASTTSETSTWSSRATS